MDRTWHEPKFGHPAVALVVHYLMAIRCDIAAAVGNNVELDNAKLRFVQGGQSQVTDPWDEYSREQGVEPVKQEVALPPSPRIAALGRVRIVQPDGSLRMYDATLGRYVDQ